MMPRRKKYALAVLPLSLVLGACQAHTTLSVSEERTLAATLEMSDDEGLAMQGATCADIDNGLQGSFPYAEEFTVEDIGDGTHLSCRFNVTFDSTFQSMAVIDNGDTLTINIPEEFWTSFNDSAEIEQFGTINSTFVLEFPGDVVDASDGAYIEGNQAIWSSYDSILGGVSATGQASATASTPTPTTPPPSTASDLPTQTTETATATTDSDVVESDSGAPLWAWILIGAGVLVGLAAIWLLIANKRRNSGPGGAPSTGPSGSGPHDAPYAGHTNPGQSGQPYEGGQPYPGGQSYGAGQPYGGGQPYTPPQQFPQSGESAQQFGQSAPNYQTPPQPGTSPDTSGSQDPRPSQQ